MKRFKYITIVVTLSVIMGSCGEDFLNLTPHSNANEEDFFRTQSEIETAMVGAYNSLYTVYGSLGVMYYFGALSSDDAYTDDRGTGAFEEFEIAQTKANNTEILNAWNSFYAAIARINKIIESTESLTFERKDSYIAEMKFLRALYYFNMTQIWGGVPLLTKNISISEAYSTGRASIDQMYEQIISDLKDATQHLSAKGSERSVGVPTKGAAYALLGKVYLTKGNKSEAAATLMNIYNNSYQLATDYADLWDLKKKNGVESIFEIQYMGGASNAPSTIGHCIHRQIILGLSRYKEADIIR